MKNSETTVLVGPDIDSVLDSLPDLDTRPADLMADEMAAIDTNRSDAVEEIRRELSETQQTIFDALEDIAAAVDRFRDGVASGVVCRD